MLRFGQVFCALFYQPLLGHQYFSNWMQRLLKLDANLQQRTEMLAEGIYTIKATNIKDTKQVVTFENVKIIIGQPQTITADFPVGVQ